jgi:hypothetical protein
VTNSNERDDQPVTVAVPAQTRRLRWWIAGITFVVGFVFGVLAVGLLAAGTPEFGAQTRSGATASPTQAPTAGSSNPVVAEARVNAACLAVINEAQDMVNVLSGVGQAVKDVDLQQLDDIVRRLQPIETRLAQDLQNCKVETDVVAPPTGGPPTPEPSTPQSTPSATR